MGKVMMKILKSAGKGAAIIIATATAQFIGNMGFKLLMDVRSNKTKKEEDKC